MVSNPMKSANDTNRACDCDGGEESVPVSPRRRRVYIPYGSVYESQDEVRKAGYWIPGIPVYADIIKVEKDTTSAYHLINPYLYTIRLKHGKYNWEVVKRYKDFSYLSNRLIAHKAVERIKMPMRRARDRIEEVIEGSDDEEHKHKQEKSSEILVLRRCIEFDDYVKDGTNIASFEEEENPIPATADKSYETDDSRENSAANLPHFPIIPDSMISETHLRDRRERLESWLKVVVSTPFYRNYHETAEFLEVSRFSFINELGGKYKEGNVQKRPGGNKVYIGCKQCCVRWFLPWATRWLMVKDTYVCYMNPHNEQIRLVLLFDEQFEINSPALAANIRPKELVLSNLQHVLTMKCDREEDTLHWIRIIKAVLEDTGHLWLKRKPFGSSFPPRINSHCQWFVDAKDYWEKASAMIEMAREEIFIADWWLCPEIYMRRPMAEGNHWRIDYVLKRQAEKGVRIFVLIYKEMEMALMLNSLLTKKHLQGLHPNIKVMRHPDHYFGTGTFFWAHHEKLLIIDQLIAFVGGLDLCYGRWDNSRHVLADLGSVQIDLKSEQCVIAKPKLETIEDIVDNDGEQCDFIDGEHERPIEMHKVTHEIKDEEGEKIGEQVTVTTIVRTDCNANGGNVPQRDPPSLRQHNFRNTMHRVIDRMGGSGGGRAASAPRDQSPSSASGYHPSQQRPACSEAGSDDITINEQGRPMLKSRKVITFSKKLGGGDAAGRSAGDSSSLGKVATLMMEPNNRTLMRRVVSNLRPSKSKRRWRMPIDQEDTAEEYVINYCRMQETTVDMSGLQGAGKLWPGKDYVNYIVKDFVDLDQAYNDFINRYETPRTPWHDIHSIVYGEAARDCARHFIQRWNATKTEKLKNNDSYPYLLPKSYDSIRIPRVFLNSDTHPVEVQVIRSTAHWSSLIDKTEDSIQQAYLSLIANAKYYIYVENQFFVSMINNSDVTNEVCRVICERVIRAHKNQEKFRVYITIPLLPGFEGDIGANYSALLAVLHWTMLSISKGPHSLIENLMMNGVSDPWDYISFTSLRNWDELCGKLVSELIYVHCKLLIVDDLYTIIGSANINDRSQLGNRDSEVCLLIKDQTFDVGKMDGKPYEAGKFAGSLRKRLMKEHLGLLDDSFHKTLPERAKEISVEDPLSDAFFYDVWCRSAADNTKIYEDTFRCYPTDRAENFVELAAWRAEIPLAQSNPIEAGENLKRLVGNLVKFPTEFLKRENLSPTITSKEGLVPSAVFT